MASDGLLVIGYGNLLRGDDAAGVAAAQRLARRGVWALAVPQLTPELAKTIAAARAVIFLDAHAAVPPGQIRVTALHPTAERAVLEHQLTPAALLGLAQSAYGAMPETWMISLGGESFGFSEKLSPAAERAVRRATAWVARRQL